MKTHSVYADIGMFAMGNDPARTAWFKLLEREVASWPGLMKHVLYGSDWLMLAKERRADEYLALFARDLRRLFPTDAERVLGANALEFLVPKGGQNADRLRRYYQRHGLRPPSWLP
jgi:hypothetical protein